MEDKETVTLMPGQTIIGTKYTKSNYVAQLEQENAELKAEIETLKKVKDFACINLNNYIADNNKLKAENERLREENYGLNQELLGYKKGVQASKIIELKQTLKEIEAIAAAPKPFIDFSETKTATEVEYDYAAICNELELRLHKVLELITKAESEEV